MTVAEEKLGIAGQPIRPHKPKCFFGRQHLWIMEPIPKGVDEAPCLCARCGAGSSGHPAAMKASTHAN